MKKQNRIWIYALIVMGLVSILPNGCTKDNNNNPATEITDADGNVYTTVTIGTQVWMVENLRTTKSSDGTPLPLVTDGVAWGALDTPGYYWSATEDGSSRGWYRRLNNDNGGVHRSSSRKAVGYSVRCLKN